MITKKTLLLSFVSVLCAATLFFAIPVSSSGTYDPWLDYNGDGIVDLKDVYPMHQAYGTSGDPTRNVNVTNWPQTQNVSVVNMPQSTDTNVWYNEHFAASSQAWKVDYRASGFGQLHVLIYAMGLITGESLLVEVHGELFNAAHDSEVLVLAYAITIRPGSQFQAFTIPVPSEYFAFRASTDDVSNCYVYLSFYLTYA